MHTQLYPPLMPGAASQHWGKRGGLGGGVGGTVVYWRPLGRAIFLSEGY